MITSQVDSPIYGNDEFRMIGNKIFKYSFDYSNFE